MSNEKWFSVMDKMPPMGQPVLVFANGVVQDVQWTYEEDEKGVKSWVNESLDFDAPVQPTDFWMPLPAPPATAP